MVLLEVMENSAFLRHETFLSINSNANMDSPMHKQNTAVSTTAV